VRLLMLPHTRKSRIPAQSHPVAVPLNVWNILRDMSELTLRKGHTSARIAARHSLALTTSLNIVVPTKGPKMAAKSNNTTTWVEKTTRTMTIPLERWKKPQNHSTNISITSNPWIWFQLNWYLQCDCAFWKLDVFLFIFWFYDVYGRFLLYHFFHFPGRDLLGLLFCLRTWRCKACYFFRSSWGERCMWIHSGISSHSSFLLLFTYSIPNFLIFLDLKKNFFDSLFFVSIFFWSILLMTSGAYELSRLVFLLSIFKGPPFLRILLFPRCDTPPIRYGLDLYFLLQFFISFMWYRAFFLLSCEILIRTHPKMK